ncbi:uncharacterized protein GGS25DRAFT_521847 [Hypoxylon fragiforme]|uniref:uncharacterized protein n=1 Tax=Hypoxylon fragiforme TaxID=63214 RepID=UPI0020C5BCFA|nr:uncharacterized protein GGS25DRAFT_521847 [Hypoxylon fragiforme]KAI2608674.1 hypothetical protein GGS25DRAFT_521847 [Hypoxylon fragiforme]
MIYTGKFWAIVAEILLIWTVARRVFPTPRVDEVAIGTADTESAPDPARASMSSVDEYSLLLSHAKHSGPVQSKCPLVSPRGHLGQMAKQLGHGVQPVDVTSSKRLAYDIGLIV